MKSLVKRIVPMLLAMVMLFSLVACTPEQAPTLT